MNNATEDRLAVIEALESYFAGMFDGDIGLLNTVFHPGTMLFGDWKGQPFAKTLVLYLSGVKHRQCPRDSGRPFSGEIISIILINSIAVARIRMTMLDHEYHELLSLHKLDGRWMIVHKLVTNVLV